MYSQLVYWMVSWLVGWFDGWMVEQLEGLKFSQLVYQMDGSTVDCQNIFVGYCLVLVGQIDSFCIYWTIKDNPCH